MIKLKKIIRDNLCFILCLLGTTLILFLNSPLVNAEDIFNYSGLSSPIALANVDTSTSDITIFPNWTYQYNELKSFYDSNSQARDNMKYLIDSLNNNDYKFIITGSVTQLGSYYVMLSKDNKEFSLNYSQDPMRYDSRVYQLNNANSCLGDDLYVIQDFPKSSIDDWIARVNTNLNSCRSGTLGSPFYFGNRINDNIVLYSNFDKNFKFLNMDTDIIIEENSYLEIFPTFNTYYNNFFSLDNFVPDEENLFDHLLKPGVDFEPGDSVTDADFNSNNENSFTSMIKKLLNMLDVYFPILNQVNDIVDAWKFKPTKSCFITQNGPYGHVFYQKCLLIPHIKINLFGHDYDLEGIDVTWFLGYRHYVQFFVKLVVGMATFLKSYKIVQGMFRSG